MYVASKGKGQLFGTHTFIPFSSTKQANPIYGRFEIPLQRREDDERERERDVWSVKSRGCAMGSWRLSTERARERERDLH